MAMKYAVYNPATHVAVPKEPTQEILACEGEYNKEQVRRIYTVILKAAAAPPHVVKEEEEDDGLQEAVSRVHREIAARIEEAKRQGFLAGARAMQEAAAKVAREQAVCGCNGEHGACMIDDPPLYIEELIRALDHEKVSG